MITVIPFSIAVTIFSRARTGDWSRIGGWMGEISISDPNDFQTRTGSENSAWRNVALVKEFIFSLQMPENKTGTILFNAG